MRLKKEKEWAMPKVSVIIPVYNDAQFLRRTLDSVIKQSLEDIEIICIDDCSNDGCDSILREYASSDSRIKNIFHSCNSSANQGRKDGVLASTGEYIMFLDGDDELHPDACSKAYEAIKQTNADVVQFNSLVMNCGFMDEGRIKSNQKLVKPHIGWIREDKNLIYAVWKKHLFGFQLWNKIYNGDICRKSFRDVEDGVYPKAQDLYAFFLFCYYAKTYYGISDTLHYYHFGEGVTGGNLLSLEKFKILISEGKVAGALERFIESKQQIIEYEDILNDIRSHFLNECLSRWHNNLEVSFYDEGFSLLCGAFGFRDVLCLMAKKYWNEKWEFSQKFQDSNFFSYKKRNKKRLCIAIYYRSIANGGAQRVTQLLANRWESQRNTNGDPLYKVILITDEAPIEDDYPLNSNVIREYIPGFKTSIGANYAPRFERLQQIIEKHDVDIVITGMWLADITFWDMLSIKGAPSKPAFIVHSHTFSAVPYTFSSDQALEVVALYGLCDGVVTLSRCDKKFVSAFNRNAQFILNPIAFNPYSVLESSRTKNSILWVGRISAEKNPIHAIKMMAYLIKIVPDATLTIVGSGTPSIEKEMKKNIEQYHLGDCIKMVGFKKDVEPYYRQSSVFISTAQYEGFSLTFAEAMSFGIPIVTYSMPWLEFEQDGRGIIDISQNRLDLMAKEVGELLKYPEKAKKIGLEGKHHVCEVFSDDIMRDWKTLFDKINDGENQKK